MLQIILIIIRVFAYRDLTTAEESVHYIVTGALDDLVNVWIFKNFGLELKHKLENHSQGVVSVAIISDISSELKCKQQAVKISPCPRYWQLVIL